MLSNTLGTTKILNPYPPLKEEKKTLGHAISSHWLQDLFVAYLCSLPFLG
jgi:hypothetical protein